MPTLDFKGKSNIYSHHLGTPFRDLEIDEKKSLPSKSGETSLCDNLIIHGDNLHALKSLLPRYAGKVKCIYIDPPYNTGNEGWKYNDNVNSKILKEWLGKEVGFDDLERHDKWLCMMWPRLNLLKELLSDDGVIFISIDDNEMSHLRLLMDEIFGAQNFIETIIWKKRAGAPNDKVIGATHEYILLCAKNIQNVLLYRKDRSMDQEARYANPDNHPKGDWVAGDLMANVKGGRYSQSLYYAVKNPNTGEEHWPSNKGNWRFNKEKVEKLLKNNEIYFGKEGKGRPKLKRFLCDVKEGVPFGTNWDDLPHNNAASREIEKIFGNVNIFDTPKPSQLVKQIFQIATTEADIVLDSFAGSGTTAHAVLDLNKDDGGNRKFILVECEDYADKITAERIRRVIKGVPKAKDENLKKGLGGSFTYCTLGKEINEENLLREKRLPSYGVLAKYVFFTATGRSIENVEKNDDYFVAKVGDDTAFFVIYKPDRKFLRSNGSSLDLTRKEKIQKLMGQKKCAKAIVFAPVCFYPIKELSQDGIRFCQLPFDIHRIIGG